METDRKKTQNDAQSKAGFYLKLINLPKPLKDHLHNIFSRTSHLIFYLYIFFDQREEVCN